MAVEVMNNQQPVEHSKSAAASQQFLFPFLLRDGKVEAFVKKLLQTGFTFFSVSDEKQQDQFYGKLKISHRNLGTYFMPNIEPIIFPDGLDDIEGLRRFSKKMDALCRFDSSRLI
ncbi:hypothetical protein [Oceanobacillus chungangensis]|uniref:Uncharacterized protein n=1 Tax=Oceanobacillus chungangensis TaxID=1229152 RepID=A0A3D8PK31_9BACI|nr:hypothetical protein [Oceanobacillus chungangensis]RDW15598.1 hypothetical protein CWR45_17650 [Oceanobacillus chungangensis]